MKVPGRLVRWLFSRACMMENALRRAAVISSNMLPVVSMTKTNAGGCWTLKSLQVSTNYITYVFASSDNYVSQNWKQESKTSQTNQPFLMHSILKRGVTHEMSKVKQKFHLCLIDHCKRYLS